ncbi:recombinase family protein [Vibrio vulnificus]|uniref:recombinase family protein n=1 Tax=Vibrio vulnificus TaxID=672 RepID=UPI0024DF360B|nr:recombinase family protein [Vibrio vulnificus]MDK2606113.1 recombinase family protein [Vibrio vulnificus]MDK2609857.1 recombinase family protein [Vibrio vulnificus]MDK2627355.1 recombinase family protein [Vibrio vulnificus]MDK2702800.1 recombinase family protein [Vibrio vulnificus]
MKYGYARVSTRKQNLDRQLHNLQQADVDTIYAEKFTGTNSNRPEWLKLLSRVESGDIIVFDSVSRMSRDSNEGIKQYFDLLERGVTLEFIKEPHINTETFGDSLKATAAITTDDQDLDSTILEGVRQYMVKLAKKQIIIAFDQSEKEASDIKQRVLEGLARSDKKAGRPKGCTPANKMSIPEAQIRKHYKEYNGTLNKAELAKMLQVSRPTLNNFLYKMEKA